MQALLMHSLHQTLDPSTLKTSPSSPHSNLDRFQDSAWSQVHSRLPEEACVLLSTPDTLSRRQRQTLDFKPYDGTLQDPAEGQGETGAD